MIIKFRASICDPFNPKIIELEEIPKEFIKTEYINVEKPFLDKLRQSGWQAK